MNDNNMNTVTTTTVGLLGFAVQFSDLDAVLKILVGLATFIFVMVKVGVAVTHNWEALRHPRRFIERRRVLRDGKEGKS